MDLKSLTAAELLEQQGSTLVIFHPGSRVLYIGLGNQDEPHAVPHCLAYHISEAQQRPSAATLQPWLQPPLDNQAAKEALQQAAHALKIQPPGPLGEGHPAPLALEGTDAAMWDAQQTGGQQSQQQQRHHQAQQGQGDSAPKSLLVGDEVTSLPPGSPYDVVWPLAGGHIQGLGVLPEGRLHDRLEGVWRWALTQRVRLQEAHWRRMAAVLLVHEGMTAPEVRLMADVILGALGFDRLAVHLVPVAATFGQGATTCCVVDIGHDLTRVCCVEDGMLLHQARCTLELGGDDVSRALLHWLRAYHQWPAEEEEEEHTEEPGGQGQRQGPDGRHQGQPLLPEGGAGAGVSRAALPRCLAPHALASDAALLDGLRNRYCHIPKEPQEDGDTLMGDQFRVLEDPGPIPLTLATSTGAPLRYQLHLGPWVALAPMALFYPALAPQAPRQKLRNAGDAAADAARRGHGGEGGGGGKDDASAGGSGGEVGDGRNGLSSGDDGDGAAGAGGGTRGGAVSEAKAIAKRRGSVEALPPAEGLFLAAAAASLRQEAGDPAEGGQQAEAGGGGGGAGAEGSGAGAAWLAPLGAYLERSPEEGAAQLAAAEPPARLPLDQAVLSCVQSLPLELLEVRQRLYAGLLLTGPGATLRGLAEALERRVAARLPPYAMIQLVNALEPRFDPCHLAWRGGALLGVLDAARTEGWVGRQQWVHGGVVVGAPGRLAAAPNRHAKLFHFLTAQQGLA